MNSQYRELSQHLMELSKTLDSGLARDESPEAHEADNPRMELIDFDELRELLKEAASKLEIAQAGERDDAVARRWFINRITSLRRGRQAILLDNQKLSKTLSLEDANLMALMQIFDEESSRLRSTATHYRQGASCGGKRKAEDYRSFKS